MTGFVLFMQNVEEPKLGSYLFRGKRERERERGGINVMIRFSFNDCFVSFMQNVDEPKLGSYYSADIIALSMSKCTYKINGILKTL